jgi:DNA-binding MurR/RpiR family transcriptional regulator
MSQSANGLRKPRILEKRIQARYDAMPGSERALADLILEYPGDILLHSATSLSERARVSKAAVTRFVKRLGYDDYRELQREVREAQEAGEPIYLNTSLVTPAREGTSLRRHLEQDLMNLRQTFEAIRPEHIDEVVAAVLAARRVWVIGFRNSHFFAGYVRRQFIQARPDVMLLPAAGQTLMEDLGTVTADDLVIIIGLRRRPPQVRRIMEILRADGVPVAYVTDRVAVATARLATWTFPCQVRGMSLFDSYVGVISLLNYICTEVAAESGDAGRVRLGRIEDLMELMDDIDTTN